MLMKRQWEHSTSKETLCRNENSPVFDIYTLPCVAVGYGRYGELGARNHPKKSAPTVCYIFVLGSRVIRATASADERKNR